jgi:PhzF family phenazine biosynthesis protein
MHHLQEIGEGAFGMDTLAGEQSVTVDSSGLVAMTQNLPTFGTTIAAEEVAASLSLTPADLGDLEALPIQIASTGLNKIFVPVPSLEALKRIEPNLAEIDRISRHHDAIGMYCYSLETLHDSTAHCRNFAPVVGISEDSATGTSAAALSCVLHRYGQLASTESLNLVFEQGYSIDEPSELHVLLKVSNGAISQVKVAGRATLREAREFAIEEEKG